MYCPKCGAKLPDGSTFCGSCGAQLSTVQPAASAPKPATPVTPTASAAPYGASYGAPAGASPYTAAPGNTYNPQTAGRPATAYRARKGGLGSKKKTIIIAAAAVVVIGVLFLILGLTGVLGGNKMKGERTLVVPYGSDTPMTCTYKSDNGKDFKIEITANGENGTISGTLDKVGNGDGGVIYETDDLKMTSDNGDQDISSYKVKALIPDGNIDAVYGTWKVEIYEDGQAGEGVYVKIDKNGDIKIDESNYQEDIFSDGWTPSL